MKQHSRACKVKTVPDIILSEVPVNQFIHENLVDENQHRNENYENNFNLQISEAYEKIVYWRKNLFELPKGEHGKEFIIEMVKQMNDWSSKSPHRDISLKALMVMPSLLLQKTSMKCKRSETKQHLKRRLQLWKNGDINDLLSEGVSLQNRLQNTSKTKSAEETARKFSRLMSEGKVNPAIRLLDKTTTGVLKLTEETMQCLREKHPEAKPKYEDMLLQGPLRGVNAVIYDNTNADLIRKCAIRTKGASGPSGLDADFWRRIVGSSVFGSASEDLCHAIALMARKLCSEDLVDLDSISTLMACRLIPLDKSPGIRPIGLGEVLRRIIGKAVMIIVKPDILNATGYKQLCAGQEAGCEIAVHAVKDIYESNETDGFIQIDASNAFNSINRNVLLHNIRIICPEIATYIINCYITPARLFIDGGKELSSNEGTTQGDPVAMGMYGLGLLPLLSTVIEKTDSMTQIAFADDLTGIGKLDKLKTWWEMVIAHGPYIGYYVNEKKSWLIIKEQYLDRAKEIFSNSKIQITTEGHRHLGAVIGTEANKEAFVHEKVSEWIKQLECLSEFAKTQPHAAFCAFVHGLRHRYTYTMRTIPDISLMLKPLDDAISIFIKTLLNGYNFNDDERILYSLPAKFGGLGLIIPSLMSDQEYRNSRIITNESTEFVKYQENLFHNNSEKQKKLKNNIKNEKKQKNTTQMEELRKKITCNLKSRALEASIENGASNWLTVLPLKKQGFVLDKQAFWDGLYIRYGIPLPRLPINCVCGAAFNVQHALSCPRGGFIIARHNEIRNFTAELLTEVCTNVKIEPLLQSLTGETLSHISAITSNEARADVSAKSLWIRGQTAYGDVRVFNPLAKCYLNQSLQAGYKRNENEKKRSYNERIINIDHGSFTPLIFSCFGGMGRECSRYYSQIADLLAEKRNLPKSIISGWLRSRLNFSMLRSCLLCIRGTRSSIHHQMVDRISESDIRVVVRESNMDIY